MLLREEFIRRIEEPEKRGGRCDTSARLFPDKSKKHERSPWPRNLGPWDASTDHHLIRTKLRTCQTIPKLDRMKSEEARDMQPPQDTAKSSQETGVVSAPIKFRFQRHENKRGRRFQYDN
jgi:hypothetical protein